MKKISFYIAMTVVFIGLTGLFISNIKKDKLIKAQSKYIEALEQKDSAMAEFNKSILMKNELLKNKDNTMDIIERFNYKVVSPEGRLVSLPGSLEAYNRAHNIDDTELPGD